MYGPEVNRRLARLPSDIWIENSRKKPGYQAEFRPFSAAPADDASYSRVPFARRSPGKITCMEQGSG